MADAIVAMAEAVVADDAIAASGAKCAAGGTRSKAMTSKAMTSGGDRRLLFVHFKERELRAGDWVATLHDGTALAGESLKRVACDSSILAVRSDETGRPSELGRKRRTVSPALMRALWLRDRHCRFPSCTHRVFVEAHHVVHWAQGGETSMANLVLLCGAHHVALHEGGFTVAKSGAQWRFYDPDGRWIPSVGEDGVRRQTGDAGAGEVGGDAHSAGAGGRSLMTHRMSLLRPDLDGSVRALVRRRERYCTSARGVRGQSDLEHRLGGAQHNLAER